MEDFHANFKANDIHQYTACEYCGERTPLASRVSNSCITCLPCMFNLPNYSPNNFFQKIEYVRQLYCSDFSSHDLSMHIPEWLSSCLNLHLAQLTNLRLQKCLGLVGKTTVSRYRRTTTTVNSMDISTIFNSQSRLFHSSIDVFRLDTSTSL